MKFLNLLPFVWRPETSREREALAFAGAATRSPTGPLTSRCR
jgi:hypothetical protein